MKKGSSIKEVLSPNRRESNAKMDGIIIVCYYNFISDNYHVLHASRNQRLQLC